MDFLDPKKKRAHKWRLLTGYVLMAIAIGLATVILVYAAYGYGINTKTGQITENGLLFVDSKPGSATIYLNGVTQNKTTSARLVLTAGKYDLTLKKAGYRDWDRPFNLVEHSIARYVYPFLFPQKLTPAPLKTYAAQPPLITQSPDRRWLLVETSTDSKGLNFDMFDVNDLTQPAQAVTLPASLVTDITAADSNFKLVEWADDNNNLLLQHTTGSTREFIVFNKSAPDKSVNVNQALGVTPTQVALRNKKSNQLYVYDATNQSLRVADLGKQTIDTALLTHVLAFKSYGTDLITYVTNVGEPSGKVQARIWNNGKTYPLYTFSAGNTYLINAAQYSGHWYYIAGSDTDSRVDIFKDPLSTLQSSSTADADPMIAFTINGATTADFSANTRFVAVQAGQRFGVYDFEVNTRYQYDAPFPLAQPMTWMDGHRFVGVSNGQLVVMDYDSTNRQTLLPTVDPAGGYFSRNYNQLLNLAPVTGGTSVTLQRSDMRAGTDLPANAAPSP